MGLHPFGRRALGAFTGLYSLVVGFAASLVLIVAASLCTKATDAAILQEFEDVAAGRARD